MATAALKAGDVFPVQGAVRIDFTQVDTTAKYDIKGLPIVTNRGTVVYAKIGTGGCAAGDYLALTQATPNAVLTATKEDTTSSGSTPRSGAVAIAAVAANSFGWVITGDFKSVPVNVANSVAAGAALTTTATGGQLGAGGDTVIGLFAAEASGASGLTACSSVGTIGTNI